VCMPFKPAIAFDHLLIFEVALGACYYSFDKSYCNEAVPNAKI
jgi:hypothetical protein